MTEADYKKLFTKSAPTSVQFILTDLSKVVEVVKGFKDVDPTEAEAIATIATKALLYRPVYGTHNWGENTAALYGVLNESGNKFRKELPFPRTVDFKNLGKRAQKERTEYLAALGTKNRIGKIMAIATEIFESLAVSENREAVIEKLTATADAWQSKSLKLIGTRVHNQEEKMKLFA